MINEEGGGMSLTGDGAPRALRDEADAEERTLNEQLTREAMRSALIAERHAALEGGRHDPSL